MQVSDLKDKKLELKLKLERLLTDFIENTSTVPSIQINYKEFPVVSEDNIATPRILPEIEVILYI